MRRLRVAAVLVFLFCATTFAIAVQKADVLTLPAYSTSKLPNGLTVLLMQQHEVPIVSINLIVKSGATADPAGKEGLASIAADLLRKGTANRSADQISGELDFIGGDFDVASSLDFTTASAEFLTKDLARGMDLIADIFLRPTFPADEIAKLTTQRIDSIRASRDRAENVIGRYFNAWLYGQHPYGRPPEGDERSIGRITRSDVQAFHETYYVPGNAILAVVGDFDTADMRAMINQRFGMWPAQPLERTQLTSPVPPSGTRLLLVDKPDSTQTYFYIGSLGVDRKNPDRVAIGIVNTLFGGRFTSRLNTALRTDTGLTYGARSVFDQRLLPGPFIISTYTRNATTEKAIDMTIELLKDLHEKGILAEELQSAKNYVKGQFPTSIETSTQLASMIARLEFYGLDAGEINNYYQRVDAITLDDTRRIIRTHFPLDNLVFVLIGKADEIRPIVGKYAPSIQVKSITDPGF